MMKLTHDDVVFYSAKWLKKTSPSTKHSASLVVTEIAFTGSRKEPDVFGFSVGCGYSIMIEAKVSRSDFLSDLKKLKKIDMLNDMWAGDYKYFACPEGLIKKEEIPEGWGLLYLNEKGKVFEIVEPNSEKTSSSWSKSQDCKILGSWLRRVTDGKIFHHRTLKKLNK